MKEVNTMLHAYKAIETKYLPCTNTKGSRIKAYCEAGSVTIPYPHELSGADVHAEAAKKLILKLGWTGAWRVGGTTEGFVFVPEHDENRIEV